MNVNYLITGKENEIFQYPNELLNSLEFSSLPPHIFIITTDAIIILLRNSNPSYDFLINSIGYAKHVK